jgi:hypothetical protein
MLRLPRDLQGVTRWEFQNERVHGKGYQLT